MARGKKTFPGPRLGMEVGQRWLFLFFFVGNSPNWMIQGWKFSFNPRINARSRSADLQKKDDDFLLHWLLSPARIALNFILFSNSRRRSQSSNSSSSAGGGGTASTATTNPDPTSSSSSSSSNRCCSGNSSSSNGGDNNRLIIFFTSLKFLF